MPFANAFRAIQWNDNAVLVSPPVSSSCHLIWLDDMIAIKQKNALTFMRFWIWRPLHQQIARTEEPGKTSNSNT
jgi:hypothetical protein